MVNVMTKRKCQEENCFKIPNFNYINEIKGI
jgi:hypothetical protein